MHISVDHGKTWKKVADTQIVLVVSPGAGVKYNEPSYVDLETKFSVEYRDADSREGGFRYPDDWGAIWNLNISNKCDGDSLMGLAKRIGAEISSGAILPNLIIAGSRGGQVVLTLLLNYFWHGPIIAINAGPLTSNSQLPEHTVPWFITCGLDYFPTRSPDFVRRKFDTAIVNVELHGMDPKNYSMLLIRTKNLQGWIYSMNIKELQ